MGGVIINPTTTKTKTTTKAPPAPSSTPPAPPPTNATQAPTNATQAPTNATQAPTNGTQAPTTPVLTQAPTNGTQAPTNATQAPTNATQAPTNATQAPTNGTQAPTNGTQAPTNGTQAPTNGTQAPTNATQAPTNATNSPPFTTVRVTTEELTSRPSPKTPTPTDQSTPDSQYTTDGPIDPTDLTLDPFLNSTSATYLPTTPRNPTTPQVTGRGGNNNAAIGGGVASAVFLAALLAWIAYVFSKRRQQTTERDNEEVLELDMELNPIFNEHNAKISKEIDDFVISILPRKYEYGKPSEYFPRDNLKKISAVEDGISLKQINKAIEVQKRYIEGLRAYNFQENLEGNLDFVKRAYEEPLAKLAELMTRREILREIKRSRGQETRENLTSFTHFYSEADDGNPVYAEASETRFGDEGIYDNTGGGYLAVGSEEETDSANFGFDDLPVERRSNNSPEMFRKQSVTSKELEVLNPLSHLYETPAVRSAPAVPPRSDQSYEVPVAGQPYYEDALDYEEPVPGQEAVYSAQGRGEPTPYTTLLGQHTRYVKAEPSLTSGYAETRFSQQPGVYYSALDPEHTRYPTFSATQGSLYADVDDYGFVDPTGGQRAFNPRDQQSLPLAAAAAADDETYYTHPLDETYEAVGQDPRRQEIYEPIPQQQEGEEPLTFAIDGSKRPGQVVSRIDSDEESEEYSPPGSPFNATASTAGQTSRGGGRGGWEIETDL